VPRGRTLEEAHGILPRIETQLLAEPEASLAPADAEMGGGSAPTDALVLIAAPQRAPLVANESGSYPRARADACAAHARNATAFLPRPPYMAPHHPCLERVPIHRER
jgi:hypothetical protein